MALERRLFVRLVAGGGVASLVAGAGPSLARAQAPGSEPRRKVSQVIAEYQDHPKEIFECATCSLFDAPSSCRVFEGAISPMGWCNLYALAD
jgi:hypothetical protein